MYNWLLTRINVWREILHECRSQLCVISLPLFRTSRLNSDLPCLLQWTAFQPKRGIDCTIKASCFLSLFICPHIHTFLFKLMFITCLGLCNLQLVDSSGSGEVAWRLRSYRASTYRLGCFCRKSCTFNIPHICHRHHRRCLCKFFLSGVKFSLLNMKMVHVFYKCCVIYRKCARQCMIFMV